MRRSKAACLNGLQPEPRLPLPCRIPAQRFEVWRLRRFAEAVTPETVEFVRPALERRLALPA